MPQYRKDGVTRRLCASVHLDEEFARWADRELTGDRLTSPGLTLGVDFVALARHARAAVLRRDTLDRHLGLLAAALTAAVAAALWGLTGGHGSIVRAAAVAFLVALAGAWYLVLRAESEARAAAREVFLDPDRAASLAAPVEPDTERWLRGHAFRRANVLPYADAAALTTPFVGSGTKIKETVWQPIDVGKPAQAPGGGPLPLRPFDAVDLHSYVAKEMERISGLDGLRVKNRLYVLGSNAHLLDDLVPDRTAPPHPTIPQRYVKAGAVRTGAGMRTHLCLERVGEGGRLIVSLYLRAILHPPSLTWEVAAYAIPPLGARFHRVDRLPVAPFEHRWSLVSHATSRFWPELRGAWGRARARRRRSRESARTMARLRREITDRHLLVDHGATTSLRAEVGEWDQAGYAERIDAQDFLFRLQQGVLVATERFLTDHNVDTGSFDKARQVISSQTYNISGDITGPANFGNHGQINAAGQQGPGPAGPGQGGPTP
ncbi:hypothetical protein [Streptomyces sp. CRN 30]|uniref:hypothetical protein n=1 Tax=Streptomyces sp. CRN 30 TaxID=3075613 RepID=UPI002A801193|nr:hypothetical protein [Streptomyces sp. CRN 30]